MKGLFFFMNHLMRSNNRKSNCRYFLTGAVIGTISTLFLMNYLGLKEDSKVNAVALTFNDEGEADIIIDQIPLDSKDL